MKDRKVFLESHQAKAQQQKIKFEKRTRLYSWLRSILIVILLILSYWAMQGEGADQWLWAWLPGLPLFLLLVRLHLKWKERSAYFQSLVEVYQEELNALNGQFSRSAFDFQADDDHPYAQELDLFGPGSLHHHLDRTFTKAGAEALAEQLLDPPFKDWSNRQEYFQDLESSNTWTMEYRAEGRLIEDNERVKKTFTDWSKLDFIAFPKWYWLPMILGLLGVWGLGLNLVLKPSALHFQWWFLALGFNLVLLGARAKVLRAQHSKLGQISNLMSSFSSLINSLEAHTFQSSYAKAFFQKYKLNNEVGKKIKSLAEILSALDQASNVVALVVLNGLFHYHLFQLRKLANWHRNFAKELPDWLDGLYEFEAHLSMANYQANHPDFVYPELNEKPILKARNLGHPLIRSGQRVANDILYDKEKYIILTGSNMSGKSTFLRTLGVNMLLAQVGTKVCAEEMHCYPFQILSSMNPHDDLRGDTSYFQAEVLRLKSLLDRLQEGRISFFLLDEILRGTNSNDKQEGTRGFLAKIEELPARGIIATHDVEIAHLADYNDLFRAAFFESRVQGEKLLFDYKLREGICKTPNASLLMKQYGLI